MLSAQQARAYARRIVRAYRRASDRRKAEGAGWYAVEGAAAQAIGGHSRSVLCAVVAAISPGLRWESNIRYARELVVAYAEGRASSVVIPTYSYRNVQKALRILDGEDPDLVLRGPKVRAFWRLLLDGGNGHDVCVDGHAVRIAQGTEGPIRGDGSDGARVSAAQYAVCAEAYRRAARVLGVQPCAVQATTWLDRRAAGQDEIPF
jgi:hypothetical protein